MEPGVLLFAQAKADTVRQIAAAWPAYCVLCTILPFAIAAVAFAIYAYISMYRALSAVSPENRDMEPGMIFLMLIPLFGIVWYFFVVLRIASSMEKEYADRDIPGDGDFGKMMGILAPLIPCVGFIMQIMWIMKIRGYTNQLAQSGGKRRRSRDDDYDDDDRPRRKRPRDDDDD
jgi:hypothetical protein